jgi:hypothetical protein
MGQGAPLGRRHVEVDETSHTLILHAPTDANTPTTCTTTTTTGPSASFPEKAGLVDGSACDAVSVEVRRSEQERMLQAFSNENNQSYSFEWKAAYDQGFNVAFIDESIQLPSGRRNLIPASTTR